MDQPWSALQQLLPPVFLWHRYAVEAAVKVPPPHIHSPPPTPTTYYPPSTPITYIHPHLRPPHITPHLPPSHVFTPTYPIIYIYPHQPSPIPLSHINPPLYLIKALGGVSYGYTLRGDTQPSPQLASVPASTQREVLTSLLHAVEPDQVGNMPLQATLATIVNLLPNQPYF